MVKFFRGSYAWVMPAAWALLIFVLSSIPHISTPGFFSFSNSDKIAHLGMYMPLGFLLFYALEEWPCFTGKATINQALIIGSLYGLSDEVHQLFVPGRYFDLGDLLADSSGIFFGCISYLFIKKYSRQLVKLYTHE